MTVSENWTEYEWIVVCGGIMSFMYAYGIGANDVANAFGTSVGSKTLKMWHVVIIAAFCEFGGSVLLGGEVTKTVAGGIAKVSAFYSGPEFFMYGMLCTLVGSFIWVMVATYNALPVSTTHSIIGGIIGFALVYGGSDAVNWYTEIDTFPYCTGIVPVVVSWFTSPICSGIGAAVLFLLNRHLILRRSKSTILAVWFSPVLVFLTVFINLQFVLFKGAKNKLHWSSSHAAWVAACIAAGTSLLAGAIFIPLMLRYLKKEPPTDEEMAAAKAKAEADIEADEKRAEQLEGWKKYAYKAYKHAVHGLFYDVHKDHEHSEEVRAMQSAAEVFDPKTELIYQFLQVFSACAVSFAHGANDVANAVGPFAGIYYGYQNFAVSTSASSPTWILCLGGAGIVIGLATYGYNITATLGVGMATMTPARGFSAELSTALTVSVCSRYGLPISTTQCIVGAEVGVGLCEGHKGSFNLMLFLKTAAAWIFTIIITGSLTAALFAQGVYAPGIQMADDINTYEVSLRNISETYLKAMNKTNYMNYQRTNFDKTLNASINRIISSGKTMFTYKKQGYIPPVDLINNVNASWVLYANYSSGVIGVNKTDVNSYVKTLNSTVSLPVS